MRTSTMLVLLAGAMGVDAASAGSPDGGLCRRLAASAARVPAAQWRDRLVDPMNTLVNAPARDGRAGRSPVERELLDDPSVREALSVEPQAPLGIERLAGTDVYRIDSFQGTANCQAMVFVEASAGAPPRRMPAPVDASPCTTQVGRFGRVSGRPLFIVGGPDTMADLTRHYQVAAWRGRGRGWSPACGLTLEFDERLQVSGRYCAGDQPLCEAAARLAPGVARAYRQAQGLDPLAFADGRQPPAALEPPLANAGMALEFPTFASASAAARDPFLTRFSSAREVARLALWLDDRWWLGVVGTAGIGWRESTTSLVVVYSLGTGQPVPAASFQVEALPAGPARARASR